MGAVEDYLWLGSMCFVLVWGETYDGLGAFDNFL